MASVMRLARGTEGVFIVVVRNAREYMKLAQVSLSLGSHFPPVPLPASLGYVHVQNYAKITELA